MVLPEVPARSADESLLHNPSPASQHTDSINNRQKLSELFGPSPYAKYSPTKEVIAVTDSK